VRSHADPYFQRRQLQLFVERPQLMRIEDCFWEHLNSRRNADQFIQKVRCHIIFYQLSHSRASSNRSYQSCVSQPPAEGETAPVGQASRFQPACALPALLLAVSVSASWPYLAGTNFGWAPIIFRSREHPRSMIISRLPALSFFCRH
jgi:hypothetical protein